MPAKFSLVVLLVLSNLTNVACAQDTLLPAPYHGRLDSLQSATLSQRRYFQVFTPPSYEPGSSKRYDVLYVLDGGNWNIGLIASIQRFIQAEGHMPPTLIVSIMGIDRNVELTPTHLSSWQAPTGGADKFLGYIKDELIPYINQHYPSNGDNTIWGHSLGGMFVVYALLKAPDAFKSYIAADPSLWWDDHYVPKLVSAALPALGDRKVTLFIAGRQGSALHEMGIDTMETILRKMAPPGLAWSVAVYPGETHSSIRFKATYDGLRFTYAGLTEHIQFDPMRGIVAKDKPITLWYDDDTAGVHYSVDGSEPTASSAKADRKVTLNAAAVVTYKRLTNRSRYDKTFTGVFKAGMTLQPAAAPKRAVPGGFNYSYYEGDSAQLRNLNKPVPVKTGVADSNFDVKTLPLDRHYTLVVSGWLQTSEDGYYTFYFANQKGAKMYVGDQLLIQYTEQTGTPYISYIVPLGKGFYPIQIEYANNKEQPLGMPYLPFYITPQSSSSNDAKPIPSGVEYHR
jgi:predicted alpha/beta superfamily hydrolase